MRRFSSFIVNHKKLIFGVYLIILVLSFIGTRFVTIEYDLSSYLPKTMNSIIGRDILQGEFSLNGSAKLLIKSNNLMHIQNIKNQIKDINGVENVIWLDDVEDIMKDENFMDRSISERFRRGEYNLLQIEFKDGNDDLSTRNALGKIDSMIKEEHYIGGPAAVSKDMQETVSREMVNYSAAAFIIISIILFLASVSYFEPLLFFIVLGASILINMGTNFIFGRISSNTYSVASILQLAVSMDYSIFLLHRFHDELQTKGKKEAMIEAIEKTFSSVSASALTTVCGFMALIAMKYGMGRDMGLVLAKGVLLSLISVITLLPVLALATEDRFDKYKHKIYLPSFEKSAKYILKIRHVVLALVLLIIVPVFLGQSKLNYYYSTEKTLSKNSSAVIANNKINELFGNKSELVLIVPKSERTVINNLSSELENINEIGSMDGLYSSVDPALPEFLIPSQVRERFEGEKYTYLVINLKSGVEGGASTRAIDKIRETASKYFKEYYLTGEPAVYLDLRSVTTSDFIKVTIVSTLLILLILLITFRSVVLPIILVFVIQTGIWINMSIPYFTGIELNFISFIIIGAISLGATVDYAILFTSRYKENLQNLPQIDAMVQTIKDTGRSVLTSALILMAGTFSISFITTIRSASELTLLIGRGAMISLILVYILLPALLLMFGRAIKYTTSNWPEIKKQG